MQLVIDDFDRLTVEAIRRFWSTDILEKPSSHDGSISEQEHKSSTTADGHMDCFKDLFIELARANGLEGFVAETGRNHHRLPGYFRPIKEWDLIIVKDEVLVAAIEFKSHVGPSFGNNFNNRCEEAIGSATDFWTAYREGAFGECPSPFLGYIILVEDCERSRSPVHAASPHFELLPEFDGASYAKRYELLCRKLVRERLYTSAALVLSSRESAPSGGYITAADDISLEEIATKFAANIAAISARSANKR